MDFAWIAATLGVAVVSARRHPGIETALLIVVLQWTYDVYVGGDIYDSTQVANRFIATAMPAFFSLFAVSTFIVARYFSRYGSNRAIAAQIAIVSLPLLAIGDNNFCGVVARVPMAAVLWDVQHDLKYEAYWLKQALLVRSVTAPGAKVAVWAAGMLSYFSGRPTVDMLGKMDPFIARLPANLDSLGEEFYLSAPFQGFQPGHMKWDFTYSITQLQPDILVFPFQFRPADEEISRAYEPVRVRHPLFGLNDEQFWVKKNSRLVLLSPQDR